MSKRLLFSITKKDLVVETFRCGGHGGQNVNKRDTGVRISHPESGAIGESREERSQAQNKKKAFERLVASKQFQNWVRYKAAVMEKGYRDIEERIDELVQEKNLKIEVIEEGEWRKDGVLSE